MTTDSQLSKFQDPLILYILNVIISFVRVIASYHYDQHTCP